jgi:hypothetical protein
MADGTQSLARSELQVAETYRDKRALVGRPSLKTPEIVAEIVEGLEAGIPLRELCASRKHLPYRTTVQRWRTEDSEFHDLLTQARARGCDALAEESHAIADDASNDSLSDKDGRPVPNHAAIARAKLRIETRLKLAALWNAKEYGDKKNEPQVTINLEHLVLASIHAAQSLPADRPLLDVTPALPAADGYEDLL